MNGSVSPLQKARFSYQPKLPAALRNGAAVKCVEGEKLQAFADAEKIAVLFPSTSNMPVLSFEKADSKGDSKPIHVGVILSGGQAPGGHNVIAGLYDGIKSLNAESRLYGFKGGPGGLVDNNYVEITDDFMNSYRNTGGFDMIGSGRTKLEQEEQFDKAAENCAKLGISALLAEYYKKKNIPIQVIGCPKTIDGDLKNKYIETSFGFDTASKVYSELIGNIERDANSAKKYWHFVKLMGRSASHIALECALKTHPNITIISEEVAAKKQTLDQIVTDIAETVAARAKNKENFGVVLIPEGLIEFIPEMNKLIGELNELLAKEGEAFAAIENKDEKMAFVIDRLPKDLASVFASLPQTIQLQLTNDRDPHGNVQVSLIETEKLLVELVKAKLKKMPEKVKFSAQTHFFGYEGRCSVPSNFDADYCYSLGYNAAAIIGAGKTAYMSYISNLVAPAEQWKAGAVPLTAMMNVERRHGADKPVIRKALVELDGKPFREFEKNRKTWALTTSFVFPGPIQYYGPAEVCDATTETLKLEQAGK